MLSLAGIAMFLLGGLVGGTVIFLLALFVPNFIAKPDRYLTRMEKKLQAEVKKLTGQAKKDAQAALKSVQDLQNKI
jgi:hypothetical protein